MSALGPPWAPHALIWVLNRWHDVPAPSLLNLAFCPWLCQVVCPWLCQVVCFGFLSLALPSEAQVVCFGLNCWGLLSLECFLSLALPGVYLACWQHHQIRSQRCWRRQLLSEIRSQRCWLAKTMRSQLLALLVPKSGTSLCRSQLVPEPACAGASFASPACGSSLCPNQEPACAS